MKNLTLEEKIKLLVGKDNNHTHDLDGKITSLNLQDGPSGAHYPEPLMWLPSLACLASTWNRDIVRQYIEAAADVCVANNVDVLLGPSVNIKKNPLCGRNFEYFSEDPYLTSELAKAYVSTLQSRGISSCVKHYLGNNREYARLFCSSNIDERTIREIYARTFESLMEVEPWSIMCSYNAVNGVFSSENQYTLKELLRETFGYKNVIVSDWGAVHHRDLALKATMDLEMPYPEWINPYDVLKDGLANKVITEEDIDNSVERIENWINKIDAKKKDRVVKFNDAQRHQIAVDVASDGYVLLKNENSILPIKNGVSVGIIGHHAIIPELSGGGSANMADDPMGDFDKRFEIKLRPLPDLLKEELSKSKIQYCDGYHYNLGFGLTYNIFLPRQVQEVCESSDVVVVVVGTNRSIECEGYDRENLKLPKHQLDILLRATKFTNNIVVVIESGGVIDVSEFKDKVKSIVYAPFGGEATNESLAKILSGKVNPSGKLSESFVKDVSVNPYLHEPDIDNEEYDDRIYVGYRLYESKNIEVEYPFGHGLSYTSFKYDNLRLKPLEELKYELSCDVSNAGEVFGKEVVQVYVNKTGAYLDCPVKELVGFAKVSLNPGEKKNVSFILDKKAFAIYDVESKDWVVKKGKYKLYIGSSVEDIRLESEIEIK